MSSPALITTSTQLVPAREALHSTPAAGGHLHADEASILSLVTEQAGHAMHVAPRMTCTQVTR